MNIRRNRRNIKMNLEQALLKYGNDITYLVLRDGTNIEIIDDYQNENDEFVEEKFDEENYGYNNYIYKEIDQNGTLRGKGLKKNNNVGKPLRKTILKSTIIDDGKLRSTLHDNNAIINIQKITNISNAQIVSNSSIPKKTKKKLITQAMKIIKIIQIKFNHKIIIIILTIIKT